ncbi:MAG TPA: vWA domain-containing protein [Urbifossiella sp.]|nr:vWA domain-containing protein [Urbifossiella sp.]
MNRNHVEPLTLLSLTDFFLLLAAVGFLASWAAPADAPPGPPDPSLTGPTWAQFHAAVEAQAALGAKLASEEKVNLVARDEIARLNTVVGNHALERQVFEKAMTAERAENKRLTAAVAKGEEDQRDSLAARKRAEGELRIATHELADARDELKRLRGREPGVRRELVRFKGKLDKVVIVLDCSGSMSSRWNTSCEVLRVFLTHLPISQVALLRFNTEVVEFPAEGFLPLADEAARARVLAQLRDVRPEGGTNTALAMERALARTGADTIILFTDGCPTNTAGDFDQKQVDDIFRLVRRTKTPPVVNTVGLGAFWDPRLAGFLVQLSESTGGSFSAF